MAKRYLIICIFFQNRVGYFSSNLYLDSHKKKSICEMWRNCYASDRKKFTKAQNLRKNLRPQGVRRSRIIFIYSEKSHRGKTMEKIHGKILFLAQIITLCTSDDWKEFRRWPWKSWQVPSLLLHLMPWIILLALPISPTFWKERPPRGQLDFKAITTG